MYIYTQYFCFTFGISMINNNIDVFINKRLIITERCARFYLLVNWK